MRNLLLASAAVLGLSAGYDNAAFAQSDENAGQAAAPAPGTITVRLNGRVRIFGGLINQGDASRRVFFNPTTGVANEAVPFTGPGAASAFVNLPAGTPAPAGSFGIITAGNPAVTRFAPAGSGIPASAPATLGAVTAPPAGAVLQYNKQSSATVSDYFRLYPGFDGVAANGLKYGASVEIRQDNNSGAGGGVYGSISQSSRLRGALYVRREWGYIGTDQLGTLRFGATDGPSGLYMTGNFENFNDGGWNGDVFPLIPAGIRPAYPFSDQGEVYLPNKLIYLSPQFYGFDFGVAFEPNTGGVGQSAGGSGCNGNNSLNAFIPIGSGLNLAGAGCDTLSSTSTGDYTRRRNTVDAGIRYRATFGPVGLAAYVDYIGSGKVNDSTPALGTGNRNQFDGLSVGMGGVAVTYAGLTVGGMAQGGRFNGLWALSPQGASDSVAWLAGVSYTYGPLVVGGSFYQYDSPGASGPCGSFCSPTASNVGFSPNVGQRRERGVNAGGTFSLAPGLALFLTYIWGERKENGFDFLTNEVTTPQTIGVGPAGLQRGQQHNYVHSQLLMLGTSFTW